MELESKSQKREVKQETNEKKTKMKYRSECTEGQATLEAAVSSAKHGMDQADVAEQDETSKQVGLGTRWYQTHGRKRSVWAPG